MQPHLTPEQELDILNTFKDLFLFQWFDGDIKTLKEDDIDLSLLIRHRNKSSAPLCVGIDPYKTTFEAEKRSPYQQGSISTKETCVLDAVAKESNADGLGQYAYLLATGIEGVVAKHICTHQEMEAMEQRPREKAWGLIKYALTHGNTVRIVVDPLHGLSLVVWVHPMQFDILAQTFDEPGWTNVDGYQSCIYRWRWSI